MKSLKKRIIVLFAAAAVLTVGIRSTLAYFTGADTKINVFTMGELEIGLKEPEWDPAPEEGNPDGFGMYPGYSIYKNPTVKNVASDKNGDEPCYARLRVTVLDGSGSLLKDQEAAELITQMIYFDETYNGTYDKTGESKKLVEGRKPGYCLSELSNFPTVNPLFVKDEMRSMPWDAVYNYMGKSGNGILHAGEEAALFTNIVVPTDWDQAQIDRIGDFKLKVEAECIQSSGFESQEEAFQVLDQEIAENNGRFQDELK